MARGCLALLLVALAGCSNPETEARDAFLAHAYAQLATDYASLATRADRGRETLSQYCATPTADNLQAAQDAYRNTALAFARIEWMRRGPMAQAHRFERLFYWPDRGGRGRQQLARFLDSEDLATIDAAGLADKSVALQGLPALEYLLYGDALPSVTAANANSCKLAMLIAQGIASTTSNLSDDWAAAKTLRQALADPDEEPPARDRALSIVVQSAAQALETAAEQKIAPAAGDSPARARASLAPLALSGNTVASMLATSNALRDLFAGPFQAALPETSRYAGEALLREVEQIRSNLQILDDAGSWSAVLADDQHHRRLLYLRQPMLAVQQQLEQSLSQALGLVQGFNSADGD